MAGLVTIPSLSQESKLPVWSVDKASLRLSWEFRQWAGVRAWIQTITDDNNQRQQWLRQVLLIS